MEGASVSGLQVVDRDGTKEVPYQLRRHADGCAGFHGNQITFHQWSHDDYPSPPRLPSMIVESIVTACCFCVRARLLLGKFVILTSVVRRRDGDVDGSIEVAPSSIPLRIICSLRSPCHWCRKIAKGRAAHNTRLMWGPLPAPFPRPLAGIGLLLGLLILILSNRTAGHWVLAYKSGVTLLMDY